jgi:hypothetical protein
MTDPKPIPRVTNESACEAFAFVARCTAPSGPDLYPAIREVSKYLAEQRALSATRKADVATVRTALMRRWTELPPEVTEALDRLGKE